MGQFPCKYLGLQLSIRQLHRGDCESLLDQVCHLVPGWQRGLIKGSGRLILIKSVMTTRPVHCLLIADVPKCVLEDMNASMRAFFCTGKKKVNGGQCIVAWNTIYKPVEFGGLGVKNLGMQGLALRV